MSHQLIGSTVVRVPFVKDVLADLVEGLAYVWIESKDVVNNGGIDLVVLLVDLLLVNEM